MPSSQRQLPQLLITVLILALASILLPACSQKASEEANLRESKSAVGRVYNFGFARFGVQKYQGHGTGFLINEHGYIVTNHHVSYGNTELFFGLSREGKFMLYKAEVKEEFPQYDIAILKADIPNPTYVNFSKRGPVEYDDTTSLGYNDSTEIDEGNHIRNLIDFISENPSILNKGSETEFKTGALKFVNPTPKKGSIEKFTKQPWGYPNEEIVDNIINHSGTIEPGYSGGPLFDSHWNVVGVNSAVKPGGRRDTGKKPKNFNNIALSLHSKYLLNLLDRENIKYYIGNESISVISPNSLWPPVAILAALALVIALKKRPNAEKSAKNPKEPTPPIINLENGKKTRIFSGDKIVAKLILHEKDGNSYRFELLASQFAANDRYLILGKEEELCDIVIPNNTASRHQLGIILSHNGSLHLEDRNGTNRVKYNGASMAPFYPQTIEGKVNISFGNISGHIEVT